MPASSNSCDILPALVHGGWPGALVCASSSISSSCGRRSSAASRSNSSRAWPRYGTAGAAALAVRRFAPPCSARPWVSTNPTTTSHALGPLRLARPPASPRSCRRRVRRREKSSNARALVAQAASRASGSGRYRPGGVFPFPFYERRETDPAQGSAARRSHGWLADEASKAWWAIRLTRPISHIRRHIPRGGNGGRLAQRVGERDVRVQPGAGGGHGVRRHRAGSAFLLIGRNAGLHRLQTARH